MHDIDLPSAWSDRTIRHIADYSSKGLLRSIMHYDDRRIDTLCFGTESLINFSSNDYLGLSFHPACVEAAISTARNMGCSSSSSLLVTGGVPPHSTLEHTVSSWIGSDSCLVFPTGYQANVGVLSSLASPADQIFSDRLNHASIVDGCRLSHAEVHVYPHLDHQALAVMLESKPRIVGNRLIVTDALFSMDGSRAPLYHLFILAKKYGALLIVDEAHSLGVLGPNGRGLSADFSIKPDVLVGTFSKALGSFGAFVCTSKIIADFLVQQSRSLMYSTALPPPIVAVNIAALQIVDSREGDSLRKRVQNSANRIRLSLMNLGIIADGLDSPIVSLEFGDHLRATHISRQLRDSGYLAWAFRPPTVPWSTSRLRLSVSAAHREEQIEGVILSIQRAMESTHR